MFLYNICNIYFSFSIPERSDVDKHFKDVPYVFVADDAFALHENMLKLYKTINLPMQKNVNYRLSRACRMIESCFGILAPKFRIFRTTIIADVCLVESITKASVCLHNWLRLKNSSYITAWMNDQEAAPGSWRNTHLQPTTHRNASKESKKVRDSLANYLNPYGLTTNVKT